ncbi:MAG: DNA-binding transcriptional regulator [Telmatospirillum sp.]|nr:DNA-binding transcriptional regulator [Telmatospirillum sp.]
MTERDIGGLIRVSRQTTYRIALLFNANKIYDRGIISGIGRYLSGTRVSWDLFLEEDFRCRLSGIDDWDGDGIIADFDDPDVRHVLGASRLRVVAVGSSYEAEADYPVGIPYVATDNASLIGLAYTHLIDNGLPRFALYSLPESPCNRWAQEREKAFVRLLRRDGLEPVIYRGRPTRAEDWNGVIAGLAEWLAGLPKPVGIVAVTDARARQVLQACLMADIPVPEEVALVGIDDDPLTRSLTRIPLSSVTQGTERMGHLAAHLLHRLFLGEALRDTRILVPPQGLSALASSRHQRVNSRHVMRARHYIRQYACLGIKTEQVADYVGISRSSLESHFRDELGCSVHQEILRFKLDSARAMLERGHLSSADIAVRCGFTSLQYMYAVFRRELGCTPRDYQIRHRSGPEDVAAAGFMASL